MKLINLCFLCVIAIALFALEMNATENNGNCRQDLTEALLKYGNNPKKWNPLNYAIEMKDYTAALSLIDFIDDINIIDSGKYPLDRLCNNIFIDKNITDNQEELLLILLLREGKNSYGISTKGLIFHTAALHGCSFSFIETLLGLGIDLHEKNGYPFLGAVGSGNISLVQHLLCMKIDLNRIHGLLNTAVSTGNLELVVYFWEELGQRPYRPWGNPLYVAIIYRYFEVFKYLLEVGVNPNDPQSLLKIALELPELTKDDQNYKIQIVEMLLKYGAKY